jgi:hypothetical protein
MHTKFWSENLEELGNDGRMILKCILNNGTVWTGPVVGSYEHVNEPFGSIKGGEID